MKRIIEFFIKEKNNLEKNLKEYAKEKEIEQQKSKILGQKQVKDTKNKRETVNS